MNALLQEMQIFAKDNNVPIIKPSAAEILCRTVAEQKSQRILEIGTAIGYSALLMAQNAADNVEIITFCWLPPLRFFINCSRSETFIFNKLMQSSASMTCFW